MVPVGVTTGVSVAVGLGVVTSVAVFICEVEMNGKLQAAVMPTDNKPVKIIDFRVLFMPSLSLISVYETVP